MAEEGTRFEHAYTCQPVCGPARACLQTGKYATQVGCFRNNIHLPLDERTIAHHFADHGYRVGYIGKWHLASTTADGIDYQTKPVPHMYRGGWRDEWIVSDVLEFTSHSYDGHMFDIDGNPREFPKGRYRVDAQTDWVLETLDSWKNSRQPFFLFISYIEPHHQNDNNRYEGPEGSKDRWAEYDVPGDLVDTEGDWRENYPDYLGCINSLDANLGRVRDKLQECGMADDTVIVYTTDHGSHFRTRNSEYKRSCHAGCTRIPMVISGPGFEGGNVVSDIVSLIDVPPTICDAAGLPIPPHHRGRSLKGLADYTPGDWPQEVFMQISESQVGRAIRTKKWCYSVYAPDKQGGRDADSDRYVEQYLYDYENDPHEKNNLVSDPAYLSVRAELAGVLRQRMTEAGEAVPVIEQAGKSR